MIINPNEESQEPWKSHVSINGEPTLLDKALFLMVAELGVKLDKLIQAIEAKNEST